jgi:hypothetical protein
VGLTLLVAFLIPKKMTSCAVLQAWIGGKGKQEDMTEVQEVISNEMRKNNLDVIVLVACE